MSYESFSSKQSVVVCYTGEGKGKTSAGIGMLARALGHNWRVAYIQFIKSWDVGEHAFFSRISPIYTDNFVFYKGGKGFFHAGKDSAKKDEGYVSDSEHKKAADKTYNFAKKCTQDGTFDLVICDEINNAIHEGLISENDVRELIRTRSPSTSLCLTGRDFPKSLIDKVDIVTEMRKIKHHFDDKFLANVGIDF